MHSLSIILSKTYRPSKKKNVFLLWLLKRNKQSLSHVLEKSAVKYAQQLFHLIFSATEFFKKKNTPNSVRRNYSVIAENIGSITPEPVSF